MSESQQVSDQPAELNQVQLAGLERAEQMRGVKPFAASMLRGDAGDVIELWWSCDLSCLDDREALYIRMHLAFKSFYADISNLKLSRGFRRLSDPGARPALDELVTFSEAVLKRLTQ